MVVYCGFLAIVVVVEQHGRNIVDRLVELVYTPLFEGLDEGSANIGAHDLGYVGWFSSHPINV